MNRLHPRITLAAALLVSALIAISPAAHAQGYTTMRVNNCEPGKLTFLADVTWATWGNAIRLDYGTSSALGQTASQTPSGYPFGGTLSFNLANVRLGDKLYYKLTISPNGGPPGQSTISSEVRTLTIPNNNRTSADPSALCVRNNAIPIPPMPLVTPAITDYRGDTCSAGALSIPVIWTPSNWAGTRMKVQYGNNKNTLNAESAWVDGQRPGEPQLDRIKLNGVSAKQKVYYRVVLDWRAQEEQVPKTVSNTKSAVVPSKPNSQPAGQVCTGGELRMPTPGDPNGDMVSVDIKSNESNAVLSIWCRRNEGDATVLISSDSPYGETTQGLTAMTFKFDQKPSFMIVATMNDSHTLAYIPSVAATIDTMFRNDNLFVRFSLLNGQKVEGNFDISDVRDNKSAFQRICKLPVF